MCGGSWYQVWWWWLITCVVTKLCLTCRIRGCVGGSISPGWQPSPHVSQEPRRRTVGGPSDGPARPQRTTQSNPPPQRLTAQLQQFQIFSSQRLDPTQLMFLMPKLAGTRPASARVQTTGRARYSTILSAHKSLREVLCQIKSAGMLSLTAGDAGGAAWLSPQHTHTHTYGCKPC